jgi:hypothetical protein
MKKSIIGSMAFAALAAGVLMYSCKKTRKLYYTKNSPNVATGK